VYLVEARHDARLQYLSNPHNGQQSASTNIAGSAEDVHKSRFADGNFSKYLRIPPL
jgi:hypothetical protein